MTASPDGYMTCREAQDVHGIDGEKMRKAAQGRGWEYMIARSDGNGEVRAFDIDQVLDWHYGCEERDVRPCVGGCGRMSMVGRYYCTRCDTARKHRGTEVETDAGLSATTAGY